MEIQSRPLPSSPKEAYPSWLGVGTLATLISASSLAATLKLTSWIDQPLQLKNIFIIPSIIGTTTLFSFSTWGALSAFMPNWSFVADMISIKELLPYLRGVPGRRAEVTDQLGQFLRELAPLARFNSALAQLEQAERLKVWSLLLPQERASAHPSTVRTLLESIESEGDAVKVAGSWRDLATMERRSGFSLDRERIFPKGGLSLWVNDLKRIARSATPSKADRHLLSCLKGSELQALKLTASERVKIWLLLSPEQRNVSYSILKMVLESTSSDAEATALWKSLRPYEQEKLSFFQSPFLRKGWLLARQRRFEELNQRLDQLFQEGQPQLGSFIGELFHLLHEPRFESIGRGDMKLLPIDESQFQSVGRNRSFQMWGLLTRDQQEGLSFTAIQLFRLISSPEELRLLGGLPAISWIESLGFGGLTKSLSEDPVVGPILQAAFYERIQRVRNIVNAPNPSQEDPTFLNEIFRVEDAFYWTVNFRGLSVEQVVTLYSLLPTEKRKRVASTAPELIESDFRTSLLTAIERYNSTPPLLSSFSH